MTYDAKLAAKRRREHYRKLARAAREALRAVKEGQPIERRWRELLWPKTTEGNHAH